MDRTPTDCVLAKAYHQRFNALMQPNARRLERRNITSQSARQRAFVATAEAAGVSVERVRQAVRRAGGGC